MKKNYSIALLINGLVALALGVWPSIYKAANMVGVLRNHPVGQAAFDAVDTLELLGWFGALLLVAAVVLFFVHHWENTPVTLVLWLVPPVITLIFVLMNYGPIFDYMEQFG